MARATDRLHACDSRQVSSYLMQKTSSSCQINANIKTVQVDNGVAKPLDYLVSSQRVEAGKVISLLLFRTWQDR